MQAWTPLRHAGEPTNLTQQHGLSHYLQGPAAASTTVSPPLLWAAQEVAAPLVAKLRAAFGGDAEAGRLDKPEWLLNTVSGPLAGAAACLTVGQRWREACRSCVFTSTALLALGRSSRICTTPSLTLPLAPPPLPPA